MVKNMIGHAMVRRDELKEEYKYLLPKHSHALAINIYKTKKNPYGFHVEVEDYMEHWHRVMTSIHMDKKAQKAIKTLKATMDKDSKPVDTSKWVTPDTESITWASIEAMIMCELTNPEHKQFEYWKGREEALYSILHCTSKTNPQNLYDMGHGDMLESVMYALRTNKKQHFGWGVFYNKIIAPKVTTQTTTKKDWNKLSTTYQAWKKQVRKDIFKPFVWDKKSKHYKYYCDYKKRMSKSLKADKAIDDKVAKVL
jgi:hypothetical protein